MAKIILGLAGRIASGKGTAAAHLKEKQEIEMFGFSNSLKETLNTYDITITRENMQKLSTFLRQNFSEDILAKAIMKKVKNAQSQIIIIDGVRRETDISNFRSWQNFYLIFVETDQKIRYDRYVKRNQSLGDSSMSFDEFLKKDSAEPEAQIEGLKPTANFVLTNNGTFEDFYKKIDRTIKKLIAE